MITNHVGDDIDELWALITEIGRLHSVRDPLADIAGLEMTSTQVHAIFALGIDGPASTSVVARRIGSPVPACTGVIDRLERLGFVVRARDVVDRRVVNVRLSETGEQLFFELESAVRERLGALMHHLSRRDRTALVILLRRLVDALARSTRVLP